MTEFDLIIVGAGIAGCVLANRLNADPLIKVLLIEAGPKDVNPWPGHRPAIRGGRTKTGLGVSFTLDLDGQGKFGPDTQWIDGEDYTLRLAAGHPFTRQCASIGQACLTRC